MTLNLLREYSENPEWHNKFKLYLYFKKNIPNDDFLKNPIFTKRVFGFPSFNIFYHILMPLRATIDRLDWMLFPAYMLPPLYLGKSIVVLTPDVYYEYKYGDLPFRYKLAYRLFTNWAAKKTTKIMAISETSKKEVARLYNIKPEKIFTNYLGINPKQNPKIPNSKSETVWDLTNSNFEFVSNFDIRVPNFILYVGQMFPRRHAKETIPAFKKLITEHSHILKNMRMSDLKLVLIGKDKYSPPIIDELIKTTNQELGGERIIHFDYIEKRGDLEKLYAGAKALVYISDREAFGLPPMEALAFGVPPIVMNNELGRELFGDYAFFAKSGNVDDITEAMREAINNEQRAMSIRNEGPEFVKKYSWKSFGEIFFKNVKN